jgi:SAM-dependent methyltransferase
VNAFEDYSLYYDLLYQDKDYRAEAAYVAGLIRHHAPTAVDVLELGCGTGMHALPLAEAGYRIHGVDLSADMLERAQQRRSAQTAALQRRLDFAHGDARTYRAARRFDAVVSLFHVFSYQTSNADLSAAFHTAATHLRSGGLLVCDYWYGPAVLTQRPETRVKRMRGEDIDVLRIAEPTIHHDRNVVDVRYDILITRRGTDTVKVVRESHPMRYLFVPELELFARDAGLMVEASMAWMTTDPLDTASWSGCSVFKKSDVPG